MKEVKSYTESLYAHKFFLLTLLMIFSAILNIYQTITVIDMFIELVCCTIAPLKLFPKAL